MSSLYIYFNLRINKYGIEGDSFLFIIIGFSGLSAYAGFFQLCKPQKGEKVFVSAAGGSVGNLVGQYAKLLGCYVVGCAGNQKKVRCRILI